MNFKALNILVTAYKIIPFDSFSPMKVYVLPPSFGPNVIKLTSILIIFNFIIKLIN